MNEHYKEYAKKKARQAKADRRRRTGGPLMRLLVVLAGSAFVVYCICAFVSTQADIAEKKQELAELEQKASELEIENDRYSSILSESDERTYMENIAINVLGYAYPNERRFYDTTRN